MAGKRTRKNSQEDAARTYAEEQIGKLDSIITELSDRLVQSKTQSKKLPVLESVSLGLYEELDKLSKKAPAEEVTDLVLGQLNEVIREVKELVADDPFIQRLKEFVAAGDNPQLRDAVVVLRQLRQGLQRFRDRIGPFEASAAKLTREARLIRGALQHYLDVGALPERDDLKDTVGAIPEKWLVDHPYPGHFNFNKLVNTSLDDYFHLE